MVKRFREWWPKAWGLWVKTPDILGKGDLRVGALGVCPQTPTTRYLLFVLVPVDALQLSDGTAFSRRGAVLCFKTVHWIN